MDTYLSIDIGTSSAKLSLFDRQGSLLATRSQAYGVEFPRPEWAEQDPEVWWRAVCALAPQVMAAAPDNHLAAISLSGQTPLCVPVDQNGIALRKAILWLDRRASPQAGWLHEHIGEERCRAVSKNRIDSYFGGAKWLWFRQNEPELFDRTWKILQATGFITYRLTGQAVIDPAQAGLCSPCFNAADCAWDVDICAAMDLPLEKLPEIHPAAAAVGQVSARAAHLTGLPAGVPVICGGGDFACACLGSGTGPNTAALMLGTAGNLLFPGVENHDPRLLHTIHLTGQPLPFGGVMAGGNLSWFAGLLGSPTPNLFESLDAEAAGVPHGSEGLIFLPYLMGERTPIWDPNARGAFIGLSSRHTRAHLFRAVLEGVAFAFRQITEIASHGSISAPGNPVAASSLAAATAIDGGSRSPLWRQIFADILNLPIHEGSRQSGTALGSAFLAVLGVGHAASYSEIAEWAQMRSTTLPDSAAVRRYDDLYPVYAGLYKKLQDDFHKLSAG